MGVNSLHLAPFIQTFRCCQRLDEPPPSLVLIHGWGLHSQIWDDVVPYLLDFCDVTLVDLPGMGRSPVSNNAQTLAQMANTIMLHLPKRFVCVGWSLGALVGMMCAQRYPSRVQALVSVAMLPCFVQKPHWPSGLPERQLAEFRALFEEDWQGALARFLSLQCQGATRQRTHINLLKQLVFFHGLPNQRVLMEALDMLAQADFLAWATDVSNPLPMLYLLGEYDSLVPLDAARYLQALRPDLDIQIIRGLAHLPFLDQPADFARRIILWHKARTVQGVVPCS